ncbi:MAG: porin family protein [Cryomorphaceae bacterium]|nr:porin family protein [Cryomorphaceae bacterium]
MTTGMIANAQLQEGSILATGGLNFSSTSDGNAYSNSFGISLTGGYFIQDNFVVGLSLSYGSASVSINDDFGMGDMSNDAFGIGAFARYYIPYTDKFSFFGQAGLAGVFSSPDENSSINNFSFELAPGFAYFFTDRIALNFSVGLIGFTSQTVSLGDNSNSVNTINFGVDLLSPRLGFSVFF